MREGTISALFAIMSDGLLRVTQIHWILLNERTQPCIDYQAELAGQFILQSFPMVKTYSTFSQGKQCITVFIIVSSSLTQLLKIGKFPTSQNHLYPVFIRLFLQHTTRAEWLRLREKRKHHTCRGGKNSQHCFLTHDPQGGLGSKERSF